jgi:trans-aconitate 2-methyltransferase
MWDPVKYLAFADHRGRPFHELIARIDAPAPRRVVDLGCGPGNLTKLLADRWPDAILEALDSSPEMVEAARANGLDARLGDVNDWLPTLDTDVVISNAVLHWVPGHRELLRAWIRALPPGAWLAIQVPGNMGAASHKLIREVAESPRWRDALAGVDVLGIDAVATPREYADLLADEGCQVDVWESTYMQHLVGEDPVLEWVTSTALRPVRAALSDEDWSRFRDDLAPELRAAYPAREGGGTWFDFRRVFMVAKTA